MRKLQTLKPRTTASLGTKAADPLRFPRIAGRRLQARNKRLFEKDPLCKHCLKEGRAVAVEVWDHVTPLWAGGADTLGGTNLQGLCRHHHDLKSAAEAAQRAAGG